VRNAGEYGIVRGIIARVEMRERQQQAEAVHRDEADEGEW
jgi:hypothetical protein